MLPVTQASCHDRLCGTLPQTLAACRFAAYFETLTAECGGQAASFAAEKRDQSIVIDDTGDAPDPDLAPGIARLMSAIPAGQRRGLPPVERWNPPFCGDLDMRIGADGSWHYMGSPIARPALVRLFASVLKREGDAYFLVTPVEKVGIKVDDGPFLAVDMAIDQAPGGRRISFRTNMDDVVDVGPAHPLRFIADGSGFRPYVEVRRGLEARLTRTLAQEIAELVETRDVDGQDMLGIEAGGIFFPIGSAVDGEAQL